MFTQSAIAFLALAAVCSSAPVTEQTVPSTTSGAKSLDKEPAPVREGPQSPYFNQVVTPYRAVFTQPAFRQTVYQQPTAIYQSSPQLRAADPQLLGVVYSAAPDVSHMLFDGYGIRYEY